MKYYKNKLRTMIDIDLKNKDGENALDIAINKGQKETAEFLKKLYE